VGESVTGDDGASASKAHPLHFILRYSDSLRGANTYEEHLRISIKAGAVWWGKFGVGVSRAWINKATKQVAAGVPTLVFLSEHGNIGYRSQLLDIRGGGVSAALSAPDPGLVPKYYRNEHCAVWFKLTNLRPISADILQQIRLYQEPYRRPEKRGMRGLIYVTIRA